MDSTTERPAEHLPLSPAHYATLREGSGIAHDLIVQRGYRTSTGYSELKSLGLGLRRDTHTQGLLLPLWTITGQPASTYIAREDRRVPFMQYRPDTPQVAQDGDEAKYLSPGNATPRLDCHPACQPLLANPAVPLWITEGIKKGDALVTHGACALTLLGVWNWRGTNTHGGKVALPEWEQIAVNGRDVRLVFDSDIMEKVSVEQALLRLGRLLTARGAHVHVVYLPSARGQKVGVDDYLLTHRLAELEALLEAPRQAKPKPAAAIPTLKLNTMHEPIAMLFNILEILTHDPRWAGVFGFDAFACVETLRQRPPYLAGGGDWQVRPLADPDDLETANWLQREYDIRCTDALAHQALQVLAHRNPYHPVRDYLRSLTWDGISRLDTWLSTYCYADDTPYHRAVGAKTLLSWVARVEAPGCKADCVTILQGEQGLYKSTVWEVLAGKPWFSDTMPDIHRKDAMEGLHGKWVIELGELAALQRSEREAVKRFVSANQDHYRPSYGRRAVTFPRQTVFVGTTNKDQLFHDETGARRFWPVNVPASCDVTALARDRDQLLAEAFARYQEGEPWHLSTEQEALAQVEQEARFELDPWEEPVLDALGRPLRDNDNNPYVTSKWLLIDCLGLADLAHHNQSHTKRLGAILRRQKWQSNKPVWITTDTGEKKQIKAWKPPLVTATTALPQEKVETGNALIPYKNNGVTCITDVTTSSRIGECENENQVKKMKSGVVTPIRESGVTTGNAVPAVTASPLQDRAPDCAPPTRSRTLHPPPRCPNPHCRRFGPWRDIRTFLLECTHCGEKIATPFNLIGKELCECESLNDDQCCNVCGTHHGKE